MNITQTQYTDMQGEIYISLDIEADGHLPGRNSMLSFAMVAINLNMEVLSTFCRNLNTLPGAEQQEEVMKFWARFPEAYAKTRLNLVNPLNAIIDARDWINNLKEKGKPTFLVYPSRFDMRFIDYYSLFFLNETLLGRNAIDLRTYAYAVLKKPFMFCSKKSFPKKGLPKLPHTHVALDDALEQGMLGVNLIRFNLGLPPVNY